MSHRKLTLLIAGLGLTLSLAGCGFYGRLPFVGSLLSGGFESNGERIYFTATSDRGTRIRSRGGSPFGGMMTGRQTCATCHGVDGKGGIHFMHMQTMDAPDIRWSVLSSGEHGGHAEGRSSEEAPYDSELFQFAIEEGTSPSGEQLSKDMPRWEMSDSDVADLIAFLEALP
jgi:mono/diheme cytochrome c family protein